MPDIDLRKCILDAMRDGHLGEETADRFVKRYERLLEDGEDAGLPFHESKVRAAANLQKEIEREAARKKRMRLKQAAVARGIKDRIVTAHPGEVDKAALGLLDFDPSGRYNAGANVAMRHEHVRGQAFARMIDFIDKFRSRNAGLTRDISDIGDVVKGLFDEPTTPEAKVLADAIHDARNFLVGRHNAAGGDIVKRKGWGWVQRHDPDRMGHGLQAEHQWKEFTRERLDFSRMYNPDGEPMSPRDVDLMLDEVWKRLTQGELPHGEFDPTWGSPVNSRIHHRELTFRDSKAWLEYQERFGNPDMFGSIVGEIDKLSRDVAVMEVLGPYPRATLALLEDAIDADRAAQIPTLSRRKAAAMRKKQGKHAYLRTVFDYATGTAQEAESARVATVMQSSRAVLVSAQLGSALIPSIGGDLATATLTAKMNGAPITRVMRRIFRQMTSAEDRKLAARMGYIAETWTGGNIAAQRLMGEVTGLAATARIADTVLRLSGLSMWTDAGRNAFKLEMIGHMTAQAAKPFDQVEPALKASMERYGITASDWGYYRSTPIWTDDVTGAEFIRPEDVYREFAEAHLAVGEHDARFRAAQKFGEMIQAEGYMAVIEPTPRTKAILGGSQRPGTFWGEVIRTALLYKNFMITHTYNHWVRAAAQEGLWNKTKYLAWAGIGMTLGGAVAEQASSLYRGKDPHDMTAPDFWGRAFVRGGGGGPMVDFLANWSGENRHGMNAAEWMLGPLFGGTMMKAGRLTVGNAYELWEKGEMKSVGPEAIRVAQDLIPGRSLWYGRLAFERLFLDEITKLTDPDYAKRFRRMERAARRDFQQRYWWRPGHPVPDRAPDMGAALGGS